MKLLPAFPRHIVLSMAISIFLMCLIFPELFVYHTFSFIRFNDTEFNYYGVFTFLSNLYHGGIGLWNPYDQMPLAYYYLAGGLTSFSNLLTSLAYIIASPFFHSDAQAYHTIYSVFYYLPSMFIRSAGNYLLLRRFTKNSSLLLFATVIGSTLLSPHFYLGLNTTSLYSFFPLILHFILYFYEHGGFVPFILCIMTLVLCVTTDPLVALGYFYQGVHFFILVGAGWALFHHQRAIRSFLRKPRISIRKQHILISVLLVVVSLVMIGPWAYMLKVNYKDYDFAGESSRFAKLNPLDFSAYFSRDSQHAPQEEFLYHLINYEDGRWNARWLYLGYSTLFLTLCGLVLSTDRRRFIFAGAAFFMFAVNSPRMMTTWQGIFHWINSITNPFNFIVRSFHMVGAFQISFFLLPLMLIGMTMLLKADLKRRLIVAGLLTIATLPYLTLPVRNYLLAGYVLSLLILFFRYIFILPVHIRHYGIIAAVLVLFAADCFGMKQYISQTSRLVPVVPWELGQGNGPYLLDFQNPKIMPVRMYYAHTPIPKFFGFDTIDPNNMQGLWYRYTNLQKFFEPPSQYKPRHVSFTPLSTDPAVQEYVQSQDALMYDTTAVTVDGPVVTTKPEAVSADAKKTYVPDVAASSVRRGDLYDIITMPLPDDFPAWIATGMYTKDKTLLQAKAGDRELMPVQGGFTAPYTFDVQNYDTGKLAISVPPGYPLVANSVILTYPSVPAIGMTSVLKRHSDRFEFTYRVERDGWLVMHYPYDPKWNLQVDGKKTDISRVNKSFIGAPLKAGTHTINLSYWPETWLRFFIWPSISLVVLVPFFLFSIGYRIANRST